MRRRKGFAPPGKPLYVHEGSLRRLIFFGYDESSESVVIGPLGFRRSDAHNVLEFGGTTVVEKRRRKSKRTRRRIRIVQRPYMGPALEKERSKLPKLWANRVRGG